MYAQSTTYKSWLLTIFWSWTLELLWSVVFLIKSYNLWKIYPIISMNSWKYTFCCSLVKWHHRVADWIGQFWSGGMCLGSGRLCPWPHLHVDWGLFFYIRFWRTIMGPYDCFVCRGFLSPLPWSSLMYK